jgi:hypothetical protein
MKKLFEKQETLKKHITNNTSKDVIERSFILNFFKELPIESLKKLINFKEIDFENKNLWGDKHLYKLLCQLRSEKVVQYTCELYLDTDEVNIKEKTRESRMNLSEFEILRNRQIPDMYCYKKYNTDKTETYSLFTMNGGKTFLASVVSANYQGKLVDTDFSETFNSPQEGLDAINSFIKKT